MSMLSTYIMSMLGVGPFYKLITKRLGKLKLFICRGIFLLKTMKNPKNSQSA